VSGTVTVGALTFLKQDLAKKVGSSGRPVIIFQHVGWPPDGMSGWWSHDAQERFFEAMKAYNVACLVHGHSHAATIYPWHGIQAIADGSTARPENPPGDFFVIRVTANELFAAHRKPDGWGVRIRASLPKPGAPTKP
jgi:cytolysin (calcineurin-like family phosphatase)